MKRTREFLVGLFALLALLVLASVTVYLRHWDVLNQNRRYFVLFKEVRKLEEGAPVNASGILVGKVARREYRDDPAHRVRVTIEVSKDLKLYPNARIRVKAAEVLGDTTLDIDDPGSGTVPLEPGSTIIGQESPELTKIVGEVSDDLHETLRAANLIINDPQNQAALKGIMTNLSSATGRLDETLTMINKEFRPLMDQLTSTSMHLNQFLASGEGVSSEVTKQLTLTRESLSGSAGQVTTSVQSIAADFKEDSRRLQDALGSLDASVKENRQALSTTIAQLNAASRTLNDILTHASQGQGTIGKLLTDPTPFEQLRQLLASLSQAITGSKAPSFLYPETAHPTPTPRAFTPEAQRP